MSDWQLFWVAYCLIGLIFMAAVKLASNGQKVNRKKMIISGILWLPLCILLWFLDLLE